MVIDLDTGPLNARPRRPTRSAGLALAAALVLVATQQVQPIPQLRPRVTLPGGTMALVGTTQGFFVIRGNGTLAWNVTAYTWAGAERWRRPLAGPDPGLAVAADAVFATHQPCDPQHPPRVDRLDPASGEPAWTSEGVLVGAADADAVLLATASTGCGTSRRVTTLQAVLVGTGRPVWTRRLDPPQAVAAAQPARADPYGWRLLPPDRRVAWGKGRIGVLDPATDVVRTVGRIDVEQARCVTDGTRLACVDTAGTTRVWHP
ncbi:hypothetical protein KZZ52_28585 [Dactylosporangium sp. AC04546]|uniref:hypothetical protein n=1 Tax=Dactylosporangium sp. AC04546 TaxID=2862460 RepID=UPI001EE00CB1|nr:hypothetical protein [Dactylosporangium sp. AC04546]WVK89227.1 hypothetical protein KZZ52_28585 [Dactylosporangium sp. AC04546]